MSRWGSVKKTALSFVLQSQAERQHYVNGVNATLQGILLGGLFGLFAAGLSLVFGVMRMVNLAHGDMAVLAAFVAIVVVNATGAPPLLTLLVVVPVLALLDTSYSGSC